MDEQQRYTPQEILGLIFLFIASLASLLFFLKFRFAAFPEHNIRLSISRQEAENKSEQLVKELNFSVEGYKRATIFEVNEASKTYLEREIGASQTASLAENEVDLWHFTTRFFRPLEKEEFTISFLPNGRFSGFRRQIEEAQSGGYLSQTAAQELAAKFLSERVNINFAEWTFVGAETQNRPNRIDHIFVWEKDNFKVGEAKLRTLVSVQGGQIGEYREFLKIPEAWERNYENERSRNDMAQTVANAATVLFLIFPIIAFFIVRYKHNDLRLRFSFLVAGIAAAISWLVDLNALPLTVFDFSTTDSWGSAVTKSVLLSLVNGLFYGVLIFFAVAAGEAIYRMIFPQGLALETIFNKAIFTKHVHRGLLVGIFAGVISFAYVLLYYFGGKQLGFWTPAYINYSDAFSTVLPWLYPLFIGFLAATLEEAIFRLFGIPFLRKYLKSTWLAVIITSVVWAFLHSAYPQSPWFARGLELIPVGVVFGFLFLRYGILAAWTAHFTFNALLIAISFYSSQSLYVSLSSTLVALLPLLVAIVIWIRYLRYKFSAVTDDLTNKSLSGQLLPHPYDSKVPDKEQEQAVYTPLTIVGRILLLVAAAASLIALKVLHPKVNLASQSIVVGREEAYQIAGDVLEEKGVDVSSFRHTVQFSSRTRPPYNIEGPQSAVLPGANIFSEDEIPDWDTQTYILDKGNFAQLKEIFPQRIPTALWSTRFFKPLNKEEYRVDILPQGTLYSITHLLEENAPGANLSTEEAIEIAKQYLAKIHSYDVNNQIIVEKSSEKRKFRTDHTIVFEEKGIEINGAAIRTRLKVLGDEPSWFYRFVKVPEEWIRERMEKHWWQTAALGIVALLIITLVVTGFIFLLRLVRQREIEWRRAYLIAGVASILSILANLNSLPTFYALYQTSIPIKTHAFQSGLGMITGLVFGFLTTAVIIGMLLALWRKYIGPLLPVDTPDRRHHLRDALLMGYTAPAIGAGAAAVITYLLIRKDWWLDSFEEPLLRLGLDTAIPAIAVMNSLVAHLTTAALVGIAAIILYSYLKRWYLVLTVPLVLMLLLTISNQHDPAKIILDFWGLLIMLLGGGLLTVLIIRKNFWGYVMAIYTSTLAGEGWQLFHQTHGFLQANGLALLLLLVLPVFVYLWWSKKDQRTTTP